MLLVKGCRISSFKFTAFLAESDRRWPKFHPRVPPGRALRSPVAGGASLAEQDLPTTCSLHRWLMPQLPSDPLRETAPCDASLPPESSEAPEKKGLCMHFKYIPRRPGPPVLAFLVVLTQMEVGGD